MKLSSKNIRSHLKKLNIKKGDNICCHANLFSFGISDLKICKYIIDNILQIIDVNQGTLVMPFYRLSGEKKIIKNKFYQEENSYLYKFFFENYKIKMSKSLTHPHIGFGKYSTFLKSSKENIAFGKGSDFEFFEKKNFKLLLLGCTPNEGATYFHHLEQLAKVPYRKIKIIYFFTNKKIKYKYNVKINHKYENNFDVVLRYFKKNMNVADLKFGKSYYLPINNIKKIILPKLLKNKFLLMKKN